tara:strand:+ start:309 stop:683 length:375 start_codon:yes stop_codon:yes gene_type:complete
VKVVVALSRGVPLTVIGKLIEYGITVGVGKSALIGPIEGQAVDRDTRVTQQGDLGHYVGHLGPAWELPPPVLRRQGVGSRLLIREVGDSVADDRHGVLRTRDLDLGIGIALAWPLVLANIQKVL